MIAAIFFGCEEIFFQCCPFCLISIPQAFPDLIRVSPLLFMIAEQVVLLISQKKKEKSWSWFEKLVGMLADRGCRTRAGKHGTKQWFVIICTVLSMKWAEDTAWEATTRSVVKQWYTVCRGKRKFCTIRVKCFCCKSSRWQEEYYIWHCWKIDVILCENWSLHLRSVEHWA